MDEKDVEKYSKRLIDLSLRISNHSNIKKRESFNKNFTENLTLVYISDNEYMSINDFSKEFGVGITRISNIIKSLVQKGLITRENLPEDKRKMILKLTPEGKIKELEFKQALSNRLEKIINTLGPENMDIFLDLSNRIYEILDEEDNEVHICV